MAARGQKERVVDPSKVTNSFEWAEAYKQGYKNVVLQDNGDLAILSSTKKQGIVKTIPHRMGYDSTVILASEENEELRALANETQQSISRKIKEKTAQKTREYLETEKKLLETIDVWQSESDSSVRRNLAYQIGRLSASLQRRDEAVQQAKYPNRYTISELVPKISLNYASKAEGEAFIHRIMNVATTPNDRNFTVADRV